MNLEKSKALLERAQKLIPGGVNSPVRAFGGVGGTPPFIARAQGSMIYDVDGNEYIDFVGSWGPMILGHRPATVIAAVQEALESGTSFGAPTEKEILLAEEIQTAVPSMEMMRLVNSGTEATMSAIRVARGFTGRDLTIKFEGCYHGHVDSLLVKAGSGLATLGTPDSAGVPKAFADTTLALPYNSFDAVEQAFDEHGSNIASIILEPVVGNMGCVLPAAGWLAMLREISAKHGALLIFDEVMTGFRVAHGGAQELFKIKPDLSAFGKIIGGGLPIGAYGGRADVMAAVAPIGKVYQAGTLSGNPVAVSAGIAMLKYLRENSAAVYGKLEQLGALLVSDPPPGITVNRAGSMFTFFFINHAVTDWDSAKSADTARFAKYFHHMLERGIYLAPSQFEAGFLSTAHTVEQIEKTRAAMREFFS